MKCCEFKLGMLDGLRNMTSLEKLKLTCINIYMIVLL